MSPFTLADLRERLSGKEKGKEREGGTEDKSREELGKRKIKT